MRVDVFVNFPILYFLFDWNPIYPGILAMFIGAVANILCRPDLKKKTWRRLVDINCVYAH